jgi:hypothetical protein
MLSSPPLPQGIDYNRINKKKKDRCLLIPYDQMTITFPSTREVMTLDPKENKR